MNEHESLDPSETAASEAAAPFDETTAAPPSVNGGPLLALAPEDYPNIDDIITEDDTPLDSIFTERQQRLLTEPLHSSWAGPVDGATFVALANVGLFSSPSRPPLVPDCLLSLEVELPPDVREKQNRSYFVWVFNKVPDVVLEIVSDRRGGEGDFKLREYARMRIPYYVIFDPDNLLGGGVLRVLELHGKKYQPLLDNRLSDVGLGLTFWQGRYEDAQANWLRWCDLQGRLIPTGKELADQECQRADQEKHRADQESRRAEEQAERLTRLEAQIRALGGDPTA